MDQFTYFFLKEDFGAHEGFQTEDCAQSSPLFICRTHGRGWRADFRKD